MLSLVISSLKFVCCDFSIFSALMPRSLAPCLTWYRIPSYTHHLLQSGSGTQGTEHIHLLQWLILNNYAAHYALPSCFLYSLASKSIKCRGYPMSIMSPRAYHKAHIKWLLVLACLVQIRDLVSCPPSLSESCVFVCNFCFGLHSDPF